MSATQTPVKDQGSWLASAAQYVTLIDVTVRTSGDTQAEGPAQLAARLAALAREEYAASLTPAGRERLAAEYERMGLAGVIDTAAQSHWTTCTPVGGRKS